jgi:hypothetical protein
MIKAIGKLATGLVKVGKPIAGRAVEEAIQNAVPGGDLGLDVTKAVLGAVLKKHPDQAVDDLTRRIDEADPAKVKELVMDVLTLTELVRAAQEDGKLSETEKVMILDAVEELREESEELLGIEE